MELFIKDNEGNFVKFALETFDKDFITNKLIRINVSYDDTGKVLSADDLRNFAGIFVDYFKKVNSDVIISCNCDMDMLILEKQNKQQQQPLIIKNPIIIKR